jgi:uncharacterized repeat protein (TIGR01451 family)
MMKGLILTVKILNVLLALALVLSGAATLFQVDPVHAAPGDNPDGALRIEIQSAYNLVVDSNVSSPSTYAPTSFSVGAKVCNDGTTALNDVVVNIGTYTNTTTYQAGIYPSRYPGDSTGFSTQHPHLVKTAPDVNGTYQFEHKGGSAGTADATRYIGTIPAGECRTHYWLLSYPQCENNDDGTFRNAPCGSSLDPVWGRTNDPNDDLWLEYDVWATSSTSSLLARERRRMTMRNEISAMANKIWPNGDNKVPDAYKQAIQDAFGWDTIPPEGDSLVSYPGQRVITTQGIWYDFGNVNQGFDNNVDLVPDYNAWVQPIGDPSSFDPGCFRLIKAYGLLIVKRQGQQELLIPFEDELYFENLPPDNTGVVGLVYYQYVAIDGACTAGLSPYQEVASGRDNEKFNADFGTGIPPLTSQAMPDGAINKTADPVLGLIVPGGTINYTIAFNNPTDVSLGLPEYGLPIVIQDSIPAGTTYVAGSAAANNTLPAGVTAYIIRYSADGVNWVATDTGTVRHIQWWLSNDLPAGASGTVTFSVTANSGAVFINTAGIGLGNAKPFAYDDAYTLASGSYSISGRQFEDTGVGPNYANGIYNTDETGTANVDWIRTSLYLDVNGDGLLDDGDIPLATNEDADTTFTFSNLPGGGTKYLVVVDANDPDLTTGWTNTNSVVRSITIDAANVTGVNFGFAPALTLDKRLTTGSPRSGGTVSFQIDVANKLPGDGKASGYCTYNYWPSAITLNQWTPGPNTAAMGAPDRVYSLGTWDTGGNNNLLAGTFSASGVTGTTVDDIEVQFYFYMDGATIDDSLVLRMAAPGYAETVIATLTKDDLNEYIGSANYGVYHLNVKGLRTWSLSDLTNAATTLRLTQAKAGSADGRVIYLDAIGFKVTTNSVCADPNMHMTVVPLTDTYDPTRLTFITANPYPDSTTPAGTLTWNNIGTIYAGGVKEISLVFTAVHLDVNNDNNREGYSTYNTGAVANAYYASGLPVNDASETVNFTVAPGGSISGKVWNNTNNNTTVDAGEPPLPGTTVRLCDNRNCDNIIYDTQITDANGNYNFIGLAAGTYVVVVTTPTGFTSSDQNYDNDGVGNTTTRENIQDIIINLTDGNSATNDRVNQNFGYDKTTSDLFGYVWADLTSLGTFNSNENGIQGVTVRLYTSNPPAACDGTGTGYVSMRTTDASGYYIFQSVTANANHYVCVQQSTLPSGWTQTGDPDLPNAQCVTCDHKTTTAIDTSGGVRRGPFNFGYQPAGTLTLGDTVFYDWNGDGYQGATDAGIPNVTVLLYVDVNNNGVIDAGDLWYASTETNGDGVYGFSNLPANLNYLVMVDRNDPDLPASFAMTKDPNETGTCKVCDGVGRYQNYTTSIDTADFGYKPVGTGQIGDTVWRDLNGDGVQSGVQETGIQGVTVLLEVNINGTWIELDSKTTDADGKYLFTNLPDGEYRVTVDYEESDEIPVGPGGYYVPSTPTIYTRTLDDTQRIYLDADFGFKPLAAIGDTVYYDANGNGEQDWNEVGIPNVTVRLINNNAFAITYQGVVYAPGAVISTTQTAYNPTNDPALDPTGFYQFTGLPTGDSSAPYLYSVQVVTGTLPYPASQTADPDRDGEACTKTDIYPNSGAFACDNATTVRVYPGTNFMGADFGYQPLGVVGDYVWLDFDNDGFQDATEVGIPGVVVTITPPSGIDLGNGDGVAITTTTDFDGYYSFVNLPDATYTVAFQTPSGMTSVGNLNQSVGTSTTVTVSGGVGSMAIDSGFRYAGVNTLSGTICMDDSSANGQCNVAAPGSGYASGVTTGETALSGTTVYAYLCTDVAGVRTGCELVGVTTTDSNGDYTFTSLPAATYSGNSGTYYAISTAAPFSGLGITTATGNVSVRDGGDQPTGTTTVVPTIDLVTEYLVSAYQTIRGTFSSGSTIQNVDFAYRSNVLYDFGDLPGTYDSITLLSNNGARHSTGDLYLGQTPSTESDGKTGSDIADADDDEGIAFDVHTWQAGGIGTIVAEASGPGYLLIWIDWDGSGDFLGENEFIGSFAVSVGDNTITFDIPADGDITEETVFMRIRLFSNEPLLPLLSFVGYATNGEVQDWSFNKDDFNPTAIRLAGFEATPQDAPQGAAAILITWETAMELDNVGFNLYRSTAAAGPYTRLNATLIPPQFPGEIMGGYYEWLDTDVQPGVTYFYKLEDIDIKGVSTFHGPVSTVAITAPTAVRLQRIDAHSMMTPLVVGLIAVMGLWVVLRRR